MTPILDTARISDVNSVMFLNRIKKMEGFELGKETEKDVFRPFTSLGQRKGYFFLLFSLKPSFCNTEYYFWYKYESSSLFGGASPISASTAFFPPCPVVSYLTSASLDGLEDNFFANFKQAQILCRLLLGTA